MIEDNVWKRDLEKSFGERRTLSKVGVLEGSGHGCA